MNRGRLAKLEVTRNFELRPDYREFLQSAGSLTAGVFDSDELPAWPGVVEPCEGSGTSSIEEDSPEYWCADLAYLHGLETFAADLEHADGWSPHLLHHGYVIGRSFGGDAFLQAADGAVFMLYRDEWDEDCVDELADMETADAIEHAVGNWVADDFRSFYQKVCAIRGARVYDDSNRDVTAADAERDAERDAENEVEAAARVARTNDELQREIADFEPGESYLFERVSMSSVGELLGATACDSDGFEFHLADREEAVVFVNSDVHVAEHCDPRSLPAVSGLDFGYDRLAVVVLGNLAVGGHLDLKPGCSLFVTGDLDAGSVTNRHGNLMVGGAVKARFVMVDSSTEGGHFHAESVETPLLIHAGLGGEFLPGDYFLLAALWSNPRQTYTLTHALSELGFEVSRLERPRPGEIESSLGYALQELGKERDSERVERLLELVKTHFEARPESVPEEAVWRPEFRHYTLRQTDVDGKKHGVSGSWKADGTPIRLRSFHHGAPHGEWLVEYNGHKYSQLFEHGVRQRPDSVPDDAVWLDDECEWEHSEVGGDGQKHGLVRWWRPDGTLVCDSMYRHGVAHGQGHRYHESGEVSQSYTWVDGKLEGERWFYGTDGHTTEHPLAVGIARAVFTYDDGLCIAGRYYDDDGNEVDAEGNAI
jgi:hypothetical protein